MPQPGVCDTARMSTDLSRTPEGVPDVRSLLREARSLLRDEEGAREAELLLMHALGVGRAWLFAHSDEPVAETHAHAFLTLVTRRAQGEPVAYLLGQREFHGLSLRVSPATLIPRPETELLVELGLARSPRRPGMRVLDLGTGSGAIALAIAQARPEWEVCASDASTDALTIARANAEQLDLQRVRFECGDWWAPWVGERFDLVLSNPPYIEENDPHLERGDLRFEPRTALASGSDGFDAIRRILSAARAHLQPGAWLLFEHGHLQGGGARALLGSAGFVEVATWVDLEGRDRVSGGRWAQTWQASDKLGWQGN